MSNSHTITYFTALNYITNSVSKDHYLLDHKRQY